VSSSVSPEELLSSLDDDQRVVAQQLYGPVCVLAGAGTGKTRAITHRIAYGVATGTYSPDRILALTFTTRAAGEMKTRLRQLGAGPVQAQTFHAAALRQLGHFWPNYVGGTMPKLFESKARPLAESAKMVGLKLDTATLRDVAGEVEWRKVNNLTIEQYEAIAMTKALPGNIGVADMLGLMSTYEQLKDDRNLIDMEDVLLLNAGLLESEQAAALEVRERYRFFVVDEYQDVSPLQHHLLSLWMGDHRDLCVVGDASQTIYSFTGATSDYLLGFSQHYSDAHVIKLERNYRSSAPIVTLANYVMRDRPGALELVAQTQQGPQPTLSEYPDDHAEARAVADAISADIASGVKPEDIAVLYRINVQAVALEQALSDRGISFHVHGATRFFDMPDVKQAIMALRGASVSVSGEPLFKSVSDVLRSLGWTQEPPAGGGALRAKWDALNALMVMADEASPETTFREFTDELITRQQSQHEPNRHAVTLASVHSSKGLEWKHVYVIGLSEGLFPISYATTLEAVSEERRLLYVAITRAQEKLALSWARYGTKTSTGRQPSRFVEEFGTHIQHAR
jgi:DNA helicase-2/ATP-dependent DNA helicase PcrA